MCRASCFCCIVLYCTIAKLTGVKRHSMIKLIGTGKQVVGWREGVDMCLGSRISARSSHVCFIEIGIYMCMCVCDLGYSRCYAGFAGQFVNPIIRFYET